MKQERLGLNSNLAIKGTYQKHLIVYYVLLEARERYQGSCDRIQGAEMMTRLVRFPIAGAGIFEIGRAHV